MLKLGESDKFWLKITTPVQHKRTFLPLNGGISAQNLDSILKSNPKIIIQEKKKTENFHRTCRSRARSMAEMNKVQMSLENLIHSFKCVLWSAVWFFRVSEYSESSPSYNILPNFFVVASWTCSIGQCIKVSLGEFPFQGNDKVERDNAVRNLLGNRFHHHPVGGIMIWKHIGSYRRDVQQWSG